MTNQKYKKNMEMVILQYQKYVINNVKDWAEDTPIFKYAKVIRNVPKKNMDPSLQDTLKKREMDNSSMN